MNLLTTSIKSIRLTRWNFGLGALTLLGVFAIALALILPDSITPAAKPDRAELLDPGGR
jgi:hypothetical protein